MPFPASIWTSTKGDGEHELLRELLRGLGDPEAKITNRALLAKE